MLDLRLRGFLRDEGSPDTQETEPKQAARAMTDVFPAWKRSDIMSRVRGRGNKLTELAMVSLLRRHRITGWRRNVKMFGNPDFVFPKQRTALFVDGCFWHGCPKHGTRPATNRAFWNRKLARNRERDRLVTRTLSRQGWFVIRVWQHDLRKDNPPCIERIQAATQTPRKRRNRPTRRKRS